MINSLCVIVLCFQHFKHQDGPKCKTFELQSCRRPGVGTPICDAGTSREVEMVLAGSCHVCATRRPTTPPGSKRFFLFLYLKKQNFKNICRIGKFSKMGACRPSSGRHDLNVKKFTFRSWHPGGIKQ